MAGIDDLIKSVAEAIVGKPSTKSQPGHMGLVGALSRLVDMKGQTQTGTTPMNVTGSPQQTADGSQLQGSQQGGTPNLNPPIYNANPYQQGQSVGAPQAQSVVVPSTGDQNISQPGAGQVRTIPSQLPPGYKAPQTSFIPNAIVPSQPVESE